MRPVTRRRLRVFAAVVAAEAFAMTAAAVWAYRQINRTAGYED